MTAKRFPDRDPSLMVDLARDQLSNQLNFVDAVEAKLGLFLGISSGLAAILVGSIAVQNQGVGPWGTIGLVVSVFAYVIVAAVCIAGLWPRVWKARVNSSLVYKNHFSLDDREIGWELANTYESFYRTNQTAFRWKVLALRSASIGLAAQTLILIATLLLVQGQV